MQFLSIKGYAQLQGISLTQEQLEKLQIKASAIARPAATIQKDICLYSEFDLIRIFT